MSLGIANQASRSYSFEIFHADMIPYSATTVPCPSMDCEQVCFQNSPNSGGNIMIGGARLASVPSAGMVLRPGDWSPWIPITNINKVYYRCLAASSWLNYMIIR